MVVGGINADAMNTVDILPLDYSADNQKCLKSEQNAFPAKLYGAMGTTLGKSTQPSTAIRTP